MDRAFVHVVIVNWNSGAQLRECLASFATVSREDAALAQVTVVDNVSADGSYERLEVGALPLTVIRTPKIVALRERVIGARRVPTRNSTIAEPDFMSRFRIARGLC
jgi:GT2 family glycosyltransferase